MAESLGLTTSSYSRDNLVIEPGRGEEVVIESGQNLVRGALIGKKAKAAGTPVADTGNTGAGTVTGFTLGAKAKKGNYTLECIATAGDGGTFQVMSPDGETLPNAEVGTAYSNAQLGFTINDGDPDFALGDKFTLPVEDGNGKFVEATSAAVDGSHEEENMRILSEDADATSEDRTRIAYKTGVYNERKITFGTGLDADTVRQGLYKVGIHLELGRET